MTTARTNWKNVNNWHWIEKDCTAWAQSTLKSHLSTLPQLAKVASIKGDVSVNQRKGRVKQIWDLEVELEFEDGTRVKVLDLMSDQAKEDLNLTVVSGKTDVKLLREQVWERVEKFRTELHEVHGKPLLVEAGPEHPGAPKVFLPSLDKDGSSVSTNGTIDETIGFMASPQDIFAALTDPERIAVWTRGTARFPAGRLQPDAAFSLYDGNVSGIIRLLDAPSRITLDWRLSHWPADHHSSVSIDVKAGPDSTRLHLVQHGVPDAEVESMRENWKRFYWSPIKMAFGYGAFL